MVYGVSLMLTPQCVMQTKSYIKLRSLKVQRKSQHNRRGNASLRSFNPLFIDEGTVATITKINTIPTYVGRVHICLME